MTRTTAFYRAEAKAEEKVLNWFRAARLWEAAIKAYPNPTGELAKRDIAMMRNRAEACHAMEKAA